MKRALLLVALLAPLLGYSQSNVLYGTVSDYGIAPQSGIKCTLTLVSPNPRVVDGVFVRRDPIERTTSTNGYFSFTNIIWGKYTFQIAGKTTTEFGIYVQTNSTGSIPLGSLATTVTPPGPNPATNYYTMSQVDSLIANATAGTNSAFYQWGSLNLSNYSTLPTNTFQPALGYAPQFGEANLTNWAALGTNTLGLFARNLNGSITNPFIVGGMNMDSNQAAPSWGEGKVFYDTASHTLAYYNDNSAVTVNIGEEMPMRVRNRSGVTIHDGDAVYIDGANGNVTTVALAIATNALKRQVYGLATTTMSDGDFGYVTIAGEVNGLATSGYTNGATLYLSETVYGGWQTNKPSFAAVQLGFVTYSHNVNGKVMVNVVADNTSLQQTQWPASSITNAPWQIGSANLTNWSSLSTNVLASVGQTNWPYQAITNAPWIETGSSGSVAQLSIGGSDAITFGQLLGDTFEFPHTVSAYGFIGSGAQLTAISGAQITGSLTNNTSGRASYATNAGTAAYVSGKLTNSISGTADEALFANSAGTATSATSANTANFATSATSATYASFATNAYSLFVSNLLQIGSSYPTILTSSSAGLSVDQPVTATSYTVGSGGPSITASGKTLTVGTNVSIGTNAAKLEYGSANTLVVTNGLVGINKGNPSAALDITGAINVSAGISGNSFVASGAASFLGPVSRARLYSSDVGNFQFRDATGTNYSSITVSNLIASGSATITNTLTASNIVSQTTVTATNFLLSVPRWKDSPIVFTWGTGATAPARTAFVPANGVNALGFVNNDVADFQTQFGHDIAPSNSTLYTEFHLHAMPMDATAWTPTTCRKTFTVRYFGAALNVSNAVTIHTNVTPVTNVFTDVLLEKNAQVLFEGNHWSFTNFYPGISGKVWGTVTVTDAGNSNYTGAVTLDMDFHYPVDRMGSSADTAP